MEPNPDHHNGKIVKRLNSRTPGKTGIVFEDGAKLDVQGSLPKELVGACLIQVLTDADGATTLEFGIPQSGGPAISTHSIPYSPTPLSNPKATTKKATGGRQSRRKGKKA